MIRAYSIGQLIEKGDLRVGSFIHYVSDRAEYKANADNTGIDTDYFFRNRNDVSWVVVYIDKHNKTIDIMPCENIDNNVSLYGIVGYMNGPKELNIIASKIASNKELGIIARCPTIEDINKIVEYKPDNKKVLRYAYYPNNARISGECEYEGNIYEETICDFDSEFYSYDGGGVEEKSEKYNLKCRTTRYDKPVFMSESCYWYEINNKMFDFKPFWLATQSVSLDLDHANFGIRCVGLDCVATSYLCDSYFDTEEVFTKGIRPIVTLDHALKLGVNDEIMNGKFSHTPFKIIV